LKGRYALSALALCGLLTLPALAMAETASQDTAGQNKSARVRKVTFCLAKTDSSDEFTCENGATWELKSDAVNFAAHVGHTVTVAGTLDHATAREIKEETKEKCNRTWSHDRDKPRDGQ
jgi:ribosomal protein S13